MIAAAVAGVRVRSLPVFGEASVNEALLCFDSFEARLPPIESCPLVVILINKASYLAVRVGA
jgi:hypothetical protein